MINLPSELLKLQQGNDLRPLKPFVLLFRNKWNSETNKYAIEETPIDVTLMVIKPNTLSMTLDVNEVAQYNANNITLTLSDKNNRFVEGTPHSYFPEGYQLYGSRMVLYYGINPNNRTALFTGVIKDLPTYKPETHQVDIKLLSPLELLKDIEAKEFSNKVTGETLTFSHTDGDGNPVYRTIGTGVGGFNAVYADGNKLFETVDYTLDRTNELGQCAYVTITNSSKHSASITADYYSWKTGLPIEQIVAGLVGVAGYTSEVEDIRNVVWNTAVRSQFIPELEMSIGYKQNILDFDYFGGNTNYWNGSAMAYSSSLRYNHFPPNFVINFTLITMYYGSSYYYRLGQFDENGNFSNGYSMGLAWGGRYNMRLWVDKVTNGASVRLGDVQSYYDGYTPITITKSGNSIIFSVPSGSISTTIEFDLNDCYYNEQVYTDVGAYPVLGSYVLTNTDTNTSLDKNGIVLRGNRAQTDWAYYMATIENLESQYSLEYRISEDGLNWGEWRPISIAAEIGATSNRIETRLQITTIHNHTNIKNVYFYILANSLIVNLVNLSGKTILEALQDFALISGYEFGVDRKGVFFFRPRVQSTEPIYVLSHTELIKVDSIKKNLSDFFTKLTLTFAERPLEFYANTGDRPTPIDKYGVINKEIDKPEIISYENPELAQAIGPQLLNTYSQLSNQLQVTAKLNLALELGDIVNLKRSYPQIIGADASDLRKYEGQQTYYRACKIIGLNYNFAKKQVSYTLQDVSDNNNKPQIELYEFVYDLPIQLGVK